MRKDQAFLIALIAPIPSTLLMEYLKTLSNTNPLGEMRVLLIALAAVFLGFLMAYVGDLNMKGYTFLKYVMALVYTALAIAGIVSLYIPKVASFHHFQTYFFAHAIFYLVWGGVYASLLLLVGRKSQPLTYVAPFLCIMGLYFLDRYAQLPPLLLTSLRYSLYFLFGLVTILMVNHFPDRRYPLAAGAYLVAFLFLVLAPLFCELPAAFDSYIHSTYLLYALSAGMNAYGLSNR